MKIHHMKIMFFKFFNVSSIFEMTEAGSLANDHFPDLRSSVVQTRSGLPCCTKEPMAIEAIIKKVAMQASLGLRDTLPVQMQDGDLFFLEITLYNTKIARFSVPVSK